MKTLIFTVLFVICAAYGNAQDSCYVYTQLNWVPAMTKYVAKIELGEEGSNTDILDKNGEKLSFYSFFNALNYLSTEGWEVLDISNENPNNNRGAYKERYAVIRKKMTIEEAKKYASPKE